MAIVEPFCALRPLPELASQICELPYDVMSSEEARKIADGNPLSFLRVSKPEIEFPKGTNPCIPEVYGKGKDNLQMLIDKGALRMDATPCFYLYRQTMGEHSQMGLVAAASCKDYLDETIKKHELTRPEKEDDRVCHMEALDAQTGPVFLTHRACEALNSVFSEKSCDDPCVDFVADDGVQHSSWVIHDADSIARIEASFREIPFLYIADGHHRSAAAGRVFQARNGAGQSSRFLSVIFPAEQMQILPYNRVLRDLNGLGVKEVRDRLGRVFVFEHAGNGKSSEKHSLGLYLDGKWEALRVRPELTASCDAIEQLDVSLLQKHVLAPIFGIEDPRTSHRISFVGGIRGTGELERLVNSGEYACAFSMYPTRIEDLMTIADGNGIMPPKSTWFEPKLRDGMFCHPL